MVHMLRDRKAPLRPVALLALLALAAAGCASDDHAGPLATLNQLEDEPLFFVQSEPATAVMEAFFDGRVVVDEAGCLRLDIAEPEGATVVWPHGFTLETHAAGGRILDGEGNPVGVLGERFRFGGGFVSTIHEGIAMAGTARALALERCPGAYWIVGEVP